MFNLYNHIEQLGKDHGFKNIQQLCAASNVPRSIMTELKKGRAKSISETTAQKFCKTMGVSMDELYGRTQKTPSPEVTGGEKNPIDERREYANSLFAGLSQEDQELALVFLKKLSQSQQVQDGRKESD